jgi:hypothetical protein
MYESSVASIIVRSMLDSSSGVCPLDGSLLVREERIKTACSLLQAESSSQRCPMLVVIADLNGDREAP